MSMVKRLMGIGGIRTRFVRNSRTNPTMVLMRSAGNTASLLSIRTKTINIITKSTINSMNCYLPRIPHLLRPVSGLHAVSADMLARIPQKKRIILLDLRGEAPENMMTAAVANDALCVGDFSRVDVLAGAAAMLKVNAFAHVDRPQSELVEA